MNEIGRSEGGRPVLAATFGDGPQRVSLIAGCHSDEPVGPETLRALVHELSGDPAHPWLSRFTFFIVPHVNPDGEEKNRAWVDRWPDPAAYLQHAFREPPGRDLEFGFPSMRVENRAVAEFLSPHAPFVLHMSLHGMGVSEGAMLLIERHCIDRTASLRAGFVAAARAAGLGLHDHDRKGDKGFQYIGPGFTTTPEAAAMRAHFLAMGDDETAALFHLSSMEFVRSLGGDPLCLVTELPLYVIPNPAPTPGVPQAYLDFRARVPDLARRVHAGESIQAELDAAGLRPLDMELSKRLQRETIRLALDAV